MSQYNKGHIRQTHRCIIFNAEKVKAFYIRLGKIQGFPLKPLLFNVVLKVLWGFTGGGIEGCMLIFCENSKIATHC